MAAANSWRVVADSRGRARWIEGEGDAGLTLRREPQAPWSRRARATLIALLPLEKYL